MLKHHSHWYLSGNSKNDTNFVYALQKYFMQHIKDQFPFITNVEYFTSRYAGQYKNYNIPLPLCYHEIDFEMQVQWLFFATSHRKSPPICDGIGGTVTCLASCTSLQRPHMLNRFYQLVQFLNYAVHIEGILTYWTPKLFQTSSVYPWDW